MKFVKFMGYSGVTAWGVLAWIGAMWVVAQLKADTAPVLKTYAGTVVGCYDADTCDVTFHLQADLGFGITSTTTFSDKVRLYGIDAWELRGEEKPKGLVARDWLNSQVRGKLVRVDIIQKSGRDARGKYGRWLAVLWLGTVNLNDQLVELGHAEYAEY
jgi:micrococcal nuclease